MVYKLRCNHWCYYFLSINVLVLFNICNAQEFKNLKSLGQIQISNSQGDLISWNDSTYAEEIYTLSIQVDSLNWRRRPLFLYTGANQVVKLKIDGRQYSGGKYTATVERALPKQFYFIPIPASHDDSDYFELELSNATGLFGERSWLQESTLKPNWRELILVNETTYLEMVNDTEEQDKFYMGVVLIFTGALGFTAIFVFMLFLLNRQMAFFYYSLYLFSFCIFGIFHTRQYSDLGLWLSNWPVIHQLYPECIIWVGMFFYGYFCIHFLEITRKNYPWLRLFIKCISWFSLGMSMVMAAVFLGTNNLAWNLKLVQWMRFLYSPLGFVGMVWILWSVKSKLKHFLVLGVGMWALLGNYSSTYAIMDGYQLTSVALGSNRSILWTCVGLLLESVMFSFGIGVKMRLSEQERIENKEALIDKMSEVQKLKQKENIALEKKVKEKTQELIRAYETVENQKKRELQESYEKRIARSEMDALRSQMNPHFIFNSLSSIKHLVLSNEREKSSVYLSKFAKLLRQILTFSRKDSITLWEELQNVKIYLELESERFSDQFSFEVDIGSLNIEKLESIQIPSMLLQPYVENALFHGLRNSTKPSKKVTVSVQDNGYSTLVTIRDNGIGRAASADFKKKGGVSLGTKITQERIDLFNQTYEAHISVTIKDVEDGTEVEILI